MFVICLSALHACWLQCLCHPFAYVIASNGAGICDFQVELQAAEIYGKPLAELADFASDVTHQDELSSLHKKTLPGSVHADDFVHDFEEGGWSSGFDDSDDDIIGGSL